MLPSHSGSWPRLHCNLAGSFSTSLPPDCSGVEADLSHHSNVHPGLRITALWKNDFWPTVKYSVPVEEGAKWGRKKRIKGNRGVNRFRGTGASGNSCARSLPTPMQQPVLACPFSSTLSSILLRTKFIYPQKSLLISHRFRTETKAKIP